MRVEAGRSPVTQLAGGAEELLVSWGAGLWPRVQTGGILGAQFLLKDYKRFMPSYLPEKIGPDFKEGSSGDVGCFILGTQMSGWLWDSPELPDGRRRRRWEKLACPWDLEGAETVSTLPRGSAGPVSTQGGCAQGGCVV